MPPSASVVFATKLATMTNLSVVPHSREQKVSSQLMAKGRFSKERKDQRSEVLLNTTFHFVASSCVLLSKIWHQHADLSSSAMLTLLKGVV